MSNRPMLRGSNKAPTAPQAKPMTVEDHLSYSRVVAEMNVPSFIPALRRAVVIVDPKLPAPACIDKYWRTYWNPGWVDWFMRAAKAVTTKNPCRTCGVSSHHNYAYLAGLWVHEVGHCIFKHGDRQKELLASDGHKWNAATDMEMNDDIPDIGRQAAMLDTKTVQMCLPRFCEVNHAEFKELVALGAQGFFAKTGKQSHQVYHPVGTGPAGCVVIPFGAFPQEFLTDSDTLSTVKLDTGKIAEAYYRLIPDPPEQQGGQGKPQPGKGKPGQGEASQGQSEGDGEGEGEGSGDGSSQGLEEMFDHGSGAADEDRQRPWEEGEPSEDNTPGVGEAEAMAIRRDVVAAIKAEAKKGRGNMPGGWNAWAEKELLPPKVSWRSKLRTLARTTIVRIAGNKRTTYRRLSRVSINNNCAYVKPSTYTNVPVVYIVCDTSGSMIGGPLDRALSEVEGILKLGKVIAYFIDCDANVYSQAQKVRSVYRARISGAGGTDMRVGIRLALKSRPAPDFIVLLTDGDTPYPTLAELKGVKIITAICGRSIEHVPAHMNPILVEIDND